MSKVRLIGDYPGYRNSPYNRRQTRIWTEQQCVGRMNRKDWCGLFSFGARLTRSWTPAFGIYAGRDVQEADATEIP